MYEEVEGRREGRRNLTSNILDFSSSSFTN